MVKGTLRKRASDWASSVLPEPVGPISRMLDFCSSTSSLPPGRAWPGRAGASRAPRVDALVVVVDGDRQHLLGAVLADHVVVEEALDLGRRGERHAGPALVPLRLLGDDVVAEPDALVADVDGRPGDELAHLALPLAAERAGQVSVLVLFPAHSCPLPDDGTRIVAPPKNPGGIAVLTRTGRVRPFSDRTGPGGRQPWPAQPPPARRPAPRRGPSPPGAPPLRRRRPRPGAGPPPPASPAAPPSAGAAPGAPGRTSRPAPGSSPPGVGGRSSTSSRSSRQPSAESRPAASARDSTSITSKGGAFSSPCPCASRGSCRSRKP